MAAEFSFIVTSAVVFVCLIQLANSAKLGDRGRGPEQGIGRYIIMFKPDSSSSESDVAMMESRLESMQKRFLQNMNITHKYKSLKRKGFSARLTDAVYNQLMDIKEDEQGFIQDVVEDTVVTINPKGGGGGGGSRRRRRRTTPAPELENPEPILVDVPWGLDRVDQSDLPLDGMNPPVYRGDGSNAHIYVVDTGIQKTHNQFDDRVKQGYSVFNNDPNTDCNGHGTHVAGTAAGRDYGVAKKAILHSVQVLNCSGSGYISEIIAGLNWVAAHSKSLPENHGAVTSMSLSARAHSALNQAVEDLTDAGVVVVVSAGNKNEDACNYSPASAQSAITVGATDRSDNKASFSNYGSCVDIFAPGEYIESAGTDPNNPIISLSGTSMACPHVSGAAAILLGLNHNLTPSEIAEELGTLSSKDKVIGLGSTTYNRLLFIGA